MADRKVTPEMMAEKEKWNQIYKVCCVASREFKDRNCVFGGVGISFLAVAIAKQVHAPNMILVAEAGYVGFTGVTSMGSPADNAGGFMAMCHQGLFDMFRDQQAGFMDQACLGLAQIDKFGNVGVSYVNPLIRMNGSGGGGDISSSAKSVTYVGEYNPRQFQAKVDYITNPGFLDGSKNARQKAGLVGEGPSAFVTDRGIFRFDPETHEMYLSDVFPWQDDKEIAEIVDAAPWDMKVAKDLKIIAPPSEDEANAVAMMDPLQGYRITQFMERPSAKYILMGRHDLIAYNYNAILVEESLRNNMKVMI
ncbi:MAG: glutaconate CoA-transferase [Deltaproteobacteria bacterium]|nr:glutaconate CoA-transferase [Deltaproteobacteria bacterium]